MIQVKSNAAGLRQSLGRNASTLSSVNARVARVTAAVTKQRDLAGSALSLGVTGLGAHPAFAEELAEKVINLEQDRPMAETGNTEINEQSISINDPLAAIINDVVEPTTINFQDKDVPSNPIDIVAQIPVPEAEVVSPDTPATLADQSISPAPIEEATPVEKEAESQIAALPTFTESATEPIEVQQVVAFVPEPAVEVAVALPQTSQDVENPQEAGLAIEQTITPEESLVEPIAVAAAPEPAAIETVAFVPEVVSEGVAAEPITVAAAPEPAAIETVAFVPEVVSEAVAAEPITVAAAPEPAAIETVAFVPEVVAEAVAAEPITVDAAAETVAFVPEVVSEAVAAEPTIVAAAPEPAAVETVAFVPEVVSEAVAAEPTIVAAAPEPAAVETVAFVPEVVSEAVAIEEPAAVAVAPEPAAVEAAAEPAAELVAVSLPQEVETPQPAVAAIEQAITPLEATPAEKEATDLIESLPAFTEAEAATPEPAAVEPVAFVPDVVPEAVAVAPTTAEVEDPSPVTKAVEEAIAPSAVSKVEKEATDLIQELPNFADNNAPAQPTTAADQLVAVTPATTAIIEEPAAPAEALPTVLGFNPVEVGVIAVSILAIGIFSANRKQA